MTRVPVTKTCKLLINGAFPRSESGRVLPLLDAQKRHVAAIAHASRKDLRDAVETASAAQPKWGAATAYNRGQVLYRIAEMMEARMAELIDSLRSIEGSTSVAARRQVEASIDRVVSFAGWTDKIAQVLGNQNPVAGPYYNFSVPEPTGVVVVVAPDQPSLLGLVSLVAPVVCSGNVAIAVASDSNPLPAVALMEIVATSDVPAGVISILTGRRTELLPHIASHREINAISAAVNDQSERRTLELGIAENLKRARVIDSSKLDWFDDDRLTSPWSIEPFVEIKTIWHPSAC